MLEKFLQKPFTFDRVIRLLIVVLLISALFLGVRALATLLVPFALAWLFAYLLLPLVRFFQYRVKLRNRGLSIGVVIILVLGLLTGVIALLVPSIVDEVRKAWELVQYYDVGSLLISLIPEELRSRSELAHTLEELLASIDLQQFFTSVQSILTRSWEIVRSTLNYLSGITVVFLFFTYLIFILLDYEDLVAGFFKLFPKRARPFVHEVVDNIEFYINSYFKGQSLISLSCGIILAIGFWIMGLPMGITFGLFVGLLNMIPYLQLLGYIPMVALCGLQAAATGQNFFIVLLFAAIVVLVSEVAQQVFLTPMIHGKSMGIKPAVILLSLTVWGYLFGFMGLLFALPLTMIVYTLYMKYFIGEPVANGAEVQAETRKGLRDLIEDSTEWLKNKKEENEDETEEK